MKISEIHILLIVLSIGIMSCMMSCEVQDQPDKGGTNVPEGMVEIQPILPGTFRSIPRDASEANKVSTRTYDSQDETNCKLDTNKLLRLPEGSTVWLIAESTPATEGEKPKYVKKSYAVYNPTHDEGMSYLVPCSVDPLGKMISLEGEPLYLKDGEKYLFYAISPARELDNEEFKKGNIGFKVKNGEYFYANDSRYENTRPDIIEVKSVNSEAVQQVTLSPLINQTAQLKFQISKGVGVHELGIQPAGIQATGLQDDSPEGVDYGDENGLNWFMSQSPDQEPIRLLHSDKSGKFQTYNYTIDSQGRVNIDVPVLPMWSISKPVIVVFRLKVNGIPSSYEMMLNEKDFKAGYSYGYKGEVSISEGVTVISWQFVSWETDVNFPFVTY